MIPSVTLSGEVAMPLVGLGTWDLRGPLCTRIVAQALALGYRLIDTAQMYDNEAAVGRAIAASSVPRAEIFLTTKVYRSADSTVKARRAIDDSLRALGTDYVDLLLLHEPYPQRAAMYRAIEDAQRAGKARAIGVSNFDARRFNDFRAQCAIAPAVNQVEAHVFYQKWTLQEDIARHGTVMQAWGPLTSGEGHVPSNPTLAAIGDKYGKTAAQVALRFLVQRGIPVIPKSQHPARLEENLALFDFTLDSDDLTRIRALDTNTTLFPWTTAY